MFRLSLLASTDLYTLSLHDALPISQTSFYIVDHFDNANVPGFNDATVRITNVGLVPSTGVGESRRLNSSHVARSYDVQLSECCGCRITPNGLIKLSVNNNLTGNAFT